MLSRHSGEARPLGLSLRHLYDNLGAFCDTPSSTRGLNERGALCILNGMIPRRRLCIRRSDLGLLLGEVSNSGGDRSVVSSFEASFAAYLGTAHARTVASGRDAIVLAFEAMGLRPGDGILVPAYTLGELMGVLGRKGYRPVPVDVEPDTFNMDPALVEQRIDANTRAIMTTHILGAPCDMKRITEIARRRSLLVLEDCAHALGATIDGRKVGTFGDAAIFSLECNKALPTYGGGILASNSAGIIAKIDELIAGRKRSKGRLAKKVSSTWMEELVTRSPFYGIINRILFSGPIAAVFERSYRKSHDKIRPSNLYTVFQAQLGQRNLALVDARNKRLNEQWRRMAEALPDGFVAQIRDRCGEPAFYNFVARSTRIAPPELRKRLRRAGVDVGIGTEVMDNCGPLVGYNDCVNAARVVEQGVLLPLYDGLNERRFARIIAAVCSRGC